MERANEAKPTMKELAEIVYWKHEAFYQTSDGRTIKTKFPVTRGDVEKEAARRKVPWSER